VIVSAETIIAGIWYTFLLKSVYKFSFKRGVALMMAATAGSTSDKDVSARPSMLDNAGLTLIVVSRRHIFNSVQSGTQPAVSRYW